MSGFIEVIEKVISNTFDKFIRIYLQVEFQLVLLFSLSIFLMLYGNLISLFALLVLELLRISSFCFLLLALYRYYSTWSRKKSYLEFLSEEEKEVLRKAVKANSITVYMGKADSVANSLLTKGILMLGSGYWSDMQNLDGYPFIIPIRLYKHIKKHANLIK